MMTRDRIELVRDYYPVAEAADVAALKVEDLIHLAAQGKLQMHVIAEQWRPKEIREISKSYDYKTGELRISVPALNIDGQKASRGDTQNALDALDALDAQELVIGPVTRYGPHGKYQALYEMEWSGPQPVLVESLSEYLVNRDTAVVKLDLNAMLGLGASSNPRHFLPARVVRIQETIDDGTLVVQEDALKKLLGRQVDLSLLDLQDDPRWPSELGLAISAWMDACDNVKRGQDVPKYIRKWLESKSIDGKPLTGAAKSRIATIANWDPTGGRPKIGDE